MSDERKNVVPPIGLHLPIAGGLQSALLKAHSGLDKIGVSETSSMSRPGVARNLSSRKDGSTNMKACVSLILLICLSISVSALNLSDGELRDRSGNTIGYVKSDGDVRDKSGNTIGYLKPDGDVRDRSGNSIGHIDADGDVRDRSGNTIGYIKSDGEVRDKSGNTIGYVNSNGDVRDKSGNTIGSARGVKAEHAAAFFFFFFNNM